MKKKSQVALESMITYGFAIMVVAASIGALYYFGFSTERQRPQFCSISGGFMCSDFVVSESQLEIVAKNMKGTQIEITGFAAAGCGSSSTSIDVPPDGQTKITIGSCSIANYYDGDFNISYVNSESGLSHNARGELRGSVGR